MNYRRVLGADDGTHLPVHTDTPINRSMRVLILRIVFPYGEPTLHCAVRCGQSIEWRLRPPLQAGKIRVFTILRHPIGLGGFSQCTPLFLVTLLLPLCFFTVSLCTGGFALSSDDALLSSAICLNCVDHDAALRLRGGADTLDPGLRRLSRCCERETVSGLKP